MKYGNLQQLLTQKQTRPDRNTCRGGFSASEQFHLFRYSRFTFSYASLPLRCQCNACRNDDYRQRFAPVFGVERLCCFCRWKKTNRNCF
ncbi:MAG: hypothetical protein ACLR5S_02890 [Ruminococcus sp.]